MYIPEPFKETDHKRIIDLVKQNAFGILVTHDNGVPYANHLPFLIDDAGPLTVLGHIARDNPQLQHFDQGKDVLAIFAGPHAYISPSNHTPPGVPTWNYTAIHLYGKCNTVDDKKLVTIIESLAHKYEKDQPSPWIPDYPDRALNRIVGFEIVVERIEAKSKLSQNRSEEDRQRIITNLGNSTVDNERGIARLMQENRSK